MTSELSNALNPRAVQSRTRARIHSHDLSYASTSTAHHDVSQRPLQSYAPHRSELELAIIPQEQLQPPVRSVVTNPLDAGTVQDLFRAVVSQNAAAQAERMRRLAWEQEQEAKHVQREAELQSQLAEMRSELLLLKASVSLQQQPLLSQPLPPAFQPPLPEPSAHIEEITSPVPTEQRIPPPTASYSASVHYSSNQLPSFVEGSSSTPLTLPQTDLHSEMYSPALYDASSPMLPSPTLTDTATEQQLSSPMPPVRSPPALPTSASTVPNTQQPSQPLVPQVSALPSPARTPSSHTSPTTPADQPTSAHALGKRRPPPSPASGYDSDDSADESVFEPADAPRKRKNGHDNRCLTIQHAMRVHLLRCMRIRSKDVLPESHDEGQPLPKDEPVRFVWEKTVKRCPHNARMKSRVLKELIAHRNHYKHVPEKDFDKKTLDATFEQAFSTLRQKYKMQKDDTSALQYKRREDQKYLKSRRRERKKTKLAKRTDRRKKLGIFSHETFDQALQPEYMSSEESCDEYVEELYPSGVLSQVQVFRTRGLAWRSSRLLRFYATLDADEAAEQTKAVNHKPRRQLTRKERCVGPPKDGFILPPQGVATWMISRRWIKENCEEHPDLEERLKELVQDPTDFDCRSFDALGEESGDERPNAPEQQYTPRPETSSSLARALALPV